MARQKAKGSLFNINHQTRSGMLGIFISAGLFSACSAPAESAAPQSIMESQTSITEPLVEYSDVPLLRINSGAHIGNVRRAGLSRNVDGYPTLVTVGVDNTIRVWRGPELTQDKVRYLPLPDEYASNPGNIHVRAMALSPDGKRVAVGRKIASDFNGSPHWQVEIFDLQSGKLLDRPLAGPTIIDDLDFSNDGLLAAGTHSDDLSKGGLWLWKPNGDGKYELIFRDNSYGDPEIANNGSWLSAEVFSVDFSIHGKLVTTSFDGHTRLYTPTRAERDSRAVYSEPIKILSQGAPDPYEAEFDETGERIALSYMTNWDAATEILETNMEIRSASDLSLITPLPTTPPKSISGEGAAGSVRGISWSADQKFVFANLSGQNWSVIRRWDLQAADDYKDIPVCSSNNVFEIFPWGKSGALTVNLDGCLQRTTDEFEPLEIVGKVDLAATHGADLISGGTPINPNDFLVNEDGTAVYWIDRADVPRFFDFEAMDLSVGEDARERASSTMDGVKDQNGSVKISDWPSSNTPKIGGETANIAWSGTGTNATSFSVDVANDGTAFLGLYYGVAAYSDENQRSESEIEPSWKVELPDVSLRTNVAPNNRTLATISNHGVIRLFDASGLEQPAVSLYVSGKTNDWILWTPSGHFAASERGEELLGFQINVDDSRMAVWQSAANLADSDTQKTGLYSPRIVAAAIADLSNDELLRSRTATPEALQLARKREGLSEATSIAKPIVNASNIEFLDTADGMQLTADLDIYSPSGKPVLEVEIGQGTHELDSVAIDGTSGSSVTLKLDPTDLISRTSNIAIAARTEDGFGQAEIVTIDELIPRGPSASVSTYTQIVKQNGTLHALVVGVSDYQTPDQKKLANGQSLVSQLYYADDDARAFAEFLEDQKFDPDHFRDVKVRLLVNNEDGNEATLQNIEDEILKLALNAKPNDAIVIFLAGHGHEGPNNEYYFMAYNDRSYPAYPTDEKMKAMTMGAMEGINSAYSERALPGTTLSSFVKSFAKAPVYIFLDTCRSASVRHGDLINSLKRGGIPKGSVYTSSETNAYEAKLWSQGAFSKVLLELVRDQKHLDGNEQAIAAGYVTDRLLDEKLSTVVKSLVDDVRGCRVTDSDCKVQPEQKPQRYFIGPDPDTEQVLFTYKTEP